MVSSSEPYVTVSVYLFTDGFQRGEFNATGASRVVPGRDDTVRSVPVGSVRRAGYVELQGFRLGAVDALRPGQTVAGAADQTNARRENSE